MNVSRLVEALPFSDNGAHRWTWETPRDEAWRFLGVRMSLWRNENGRVMAVSNDEAAAVGRMLLRVQVDAERFELGPVSLFLARPGFGAALEFAPVSFFSRPGALVVATMFVPFDIHFRRGGVYCCDGAWRIERTIGGLR